MEGGMEGTADIDLSEVFAHFWTEVGKKVGWWRLMAWHPKRRSLWYVVHHTHKSVQRRISLYNGRKAETAAYGAMPALWRT